MLNAQQIFINGIWTFYIEQRPHGRDHPVEGRLTLFGPAASLRPGWVDYFALRVANFDKQSITRDLIRRGVAAEKDEDGDAGFHVKDSDGFRVQIIRE